MYLATGEFWHLVNESNTADKQLMLRHPALHPLLDLLWCDVTLGVVFKRYVRSWPLFLMAKMYQQRR